MRAKAILVFMPFAAVINNCSVQEISTDCRDYEIIGVNRPKHFRLDLKDSITGEVHRDAYVSKHFSAWETFKVGRHVRLTKVVKKITRLGKVSYCVDFPKASAELGGYLLKEWTE